MRNSRALSGSVDFSMSTFRHERFYTAFSRKGAKGTTDLTDYLANIRSFIREICGSLLYSSRHATCSLNPETKHAGRST